MNNAEVLIKFKGDTTDVDKAMGNATTSLTKLTKAFTIGNLAAKGISKGIEVFSENLDGAISRVDTMNNFPKVMKLFGVSADEASESINRIDQSVRGLPTSLDQAVAGVQNIFMVTQDLQEAEKLFQSINDSAMVFANGSTEAVNNFIYGYKQALSAGKVSAQDFNQMNQAIPGLMTKVAEVIGVSYADLKEGLSKGTISIDQFNSALKKLDTEGVGSMSSLQSAAKTSTGGIKTSITNMKTAFVRGIADIVSQINSSLEEFGGLSGVISSIGKIGEQVFKKIGKVLSVVIPKLISFGKWIVKNKDWIIPLTAAIGTFVATFKTIKTVISVIKGVNTAMKLLNKTIAANKITIIISAIVAVIAGLVMLYNKCEWFRNFINGWVEGFKLMIQGIVDFFKGAIDKIKSFIDGWVNGFKIMINGIVSFFKGAVDKVVGFVNGVIDFFKTNWQGILLFIVNPFAGAFKLLYDNCEGFRNMINTVINAVKGFFTGLWNSMKTGAVNAWNGIKSVFSTVASFFKNIFTNAWNAVKNVFSTGGKIFVGIKDGIVNAFKSIVNGLIGGINKVISMPFNQLNKVLNKIRNVSILGKKPFKGLIGTISVPKIPKLATGTNEVPQDMLAMIHKGEAVVPKKFNPYANGINSSMLGTMNNSHSKQVINVYANFKQDNLGQMVRDIKTFSGGARNDYNYGM